EAQSEFLAGMLTTSGAPASKHPGILASTPLDPTAPPCHGPFQNLFSPEVRQVRCGVWAHRTAIIDPQVRFVGGIAIGAGVNLRAGDVVIGPCVLGDRIMVE